MAPSPVRPRSDSEAVAVVQQQSAEIVSEFPFLAGRLTLKKASSSSGDTPAAGQTDEGEGGQKTIEKEKATETTENSRGAGTN